MKEDMIVKKKNTDAEINSIIDRMIVAAGVQNPSQLSDFIMKSRSVFDGWRKRGTVPKTVIELVSLKTGYTKHWLLTGEPPEKEATFNAVMMVREDHEGFSPGTTTLTKQEKNELTMLRYLAKHHPEYRQRLSDEIQEIYILATTKTEG
jgi:hypothetical protein